MQPMAGGGSGAAAGTTHHHHTTAGGMVNLTMGDSALVVTGGDEGKICMNLAGAINREMDTFLPIIAGAIALGTGCAMALVEPDSDVPEVAVH